MDAGNDRVQNVTPRDLEGDLVDELSPLYGVVWINPGRLGGTPCFFGTRVPARALFDYLDAGRSIDEFLGDFPGVTREMVSQMLGMVHELFAHMGRAA